ncbi:MAG TPA: hypothetical protein VFA59_08105 [Vicinamibacterales bacterium]|nr:hypothetical protein [Vicinamibacterales bacterium]
MHTAQINRASSICILVLSLIAFGVVVVGLIVPAIRLGSIPPPAPDENAYAHIFQLSMVLLLPAGCVFLATADWEKPLQLARRLMLPGAAVVLAFSVLYYFEKYAPAHR